MYNLTGKKIVERVTIQKGEPIDLSKHKNGIYIFEIVIGGMIERGKLILE
jgi:hypothetical protein